MQVSIGIFTHNDADTIGEVIEAFLDQETAIADITEIIVVCCECTDDTVATISKHARGDDRVRVVERERRQGKVAAINTFLAAATGEVVVISGGDIVPGPSLVERLTAPIAADHRCSMTGPQVLSAATGSPTLAARLHDVLWRLHHEVALRAPKLGETIAVRRSALPQSLPGGVHCDEVLIESLVIRDGGQLTYVPEAQVRNFPPRRVSHLYGQRRRVVCQHASARSLLHYRPATSRMSNVLPALGTTARGEHTVWGPLAGLVALQTLAVLHGYLDYLRGRRYSVWQPVGRDAAVLRPAVDRPASADGQKP
ncbi:glycosyltransferase [Streptomyces sp. NPDC048179]|uniref:glycosyltransferase n=1 Tax=Streptomyces sp. NPDC048179 TaxID=3365506 RepID=UPI00371880D0